ncbi:MAG: hypothetical protein GXX79_14610 [Actinomycetales bacterium]|nr:hypothetical protein [Actinomycetales bacterium]
MNPTPPQDEQVPGDQPTPEDQQVPEDPEALEDQEGREPADEEDGAGPESLVIQAREALGAEDIEGAVELLRSAADGFLAEEDPEEAVRCLRMAVTLRRSLGDLAGAERLAADAVAVAPPSTPAAILAQAELQRTRSVTFLVVGKPLDAVEAIRLGTAAFREVGDEAAALRYLVESITLVQGAGFAEEADLLTAEAGPAAESMRDHASLGDLALIAASRAVDAGDLDAARLHAKHAREEALAGRTGPQYVAAAVAECRLAEAAGDLTEAYASLAVAWVTLGDLVGEESAQAAVEPLLLEARQRWGAEVFDEAKASYEERRRAEGPPKGRARGEAGL